MGEVFGWGREDAFQLRSTSWKHAFCVTERLGGGFVRTTKEDKGEREVCLFHRIGLRVPIPWEKSLKDY